MTTPLQELIKFIQNDRMQDTYTKDQILELLNYKLEEETKQIENLRKRIEELGNLILKNK